MHNQQLKIYWLSALEINILKKLDDNVKTVGGVPSTSNWRKDVSMSYSELSYDV